MGQKRRVRTRRFPHRRPSPQLPYPARTIGPRSSGPINQDGGTEAETAEVEVVEMEEDRNSRLALVESPGGVSPPGAPRTVREPLDSHGSRCSAAPMT